MGPIYAVGVAWLLWALFLPLYAPLHFVGCCGVAGGVHHRAVLHLEGPYHRPARQRGGAAAPEERAPPPRRLTPSSRRTRRPLPSRLSGPGP